MLNLCEQSNVPVSPFHGYSAEFGTEQQNPWKLVLDPPPPPQNTQKMSSQYILLFSINSLPVV